MQTKLFIFVLCLCHTLCYSQVGDSISKKFTLISIGFEAGQGIDRYDRMNLEMMHGFTKDPELLDRNLDGHKITADRIIEGSRVGLHLAFIPTKKNIDEKTSTDEIRVGIVYSVKGTSVDYSKVESDESMYSVNYSARFKEVSLHGAYVWKFSPESARRFTFYGGIGLGIGSTVYDKTSVAEHISGGQPNEIPFSIFNVYKGNSSLIVRPHIPLGIDFALMERFDIGISGSTGIAIQKVYGGQSYLIPFGASISAKLSYFF